ncbi:MAG: hypothetical protein ACTHQE_06075 [Thermomicrobiales bacterium]
MTGSGWRRAVRERVVAAGMALLMAVTLGTPLTGTAVAQDATPPASPATTSTTGVSFSVNPKGQVDGSFFQEKAKAGDTLELTVQFGNLGKDAIDLRTYVADVVTLTNGGMGVTAEGTASQAPTTWISYSPGTYTLQPNEGREISFKVAIPYDAAPGNYVSALVVQTADPVPVEGTPLFDQIIQKAVAIDITVEGDAKPGLEIGAATYDASGSSPTLSVEIRNPGALRLRPAGTIAVKDAKGEEVLSANVAMGSVYARTETLLQFVLQQPLPAGSYTIDLTLSDAETKVEATVKDLAFEARAPATPIQTAIVFQDIAIAAGPDANAPQFATVTGSIVNNGTPLPNARLSITAYKDGTEVETFQLLPSVSLATGSTPVQQRYIPGTGFSKGTWTFVLTLESIDPATGVATKLIEQPVESQIVVP